MEKKYGLYTGRFQPLHFGHQAIVNEIYHDGLEPHIIIGSSNDDRDLAKNPYPYSMRADMFHAVFGEDIRTFRLDDVKTCDEWWNQLCSLVDVDPYHPDECVLYHFDKPIDKRERIYFRGYDYKDVHFTDILPVDKKYVSYPQRLGISELSATWLRNNMGAHKHMIDYRVYNMIKEYEHAIC